MNYEKYKAICKEIEMFQLLDCISIEVNSFILIDLLLDNNYIFRHLKEKHNHCIERVDTKRPGECGYGFSCEWLKIFEILTYFYAYQRISKNDLLYFVWAIRYNIVHDENKVNIVEFLKNTSKRTIKINEKIYASFMKYDLVDVLQNVLKDTLYLPNSYLGIYQNEAIKKIVEEYCRERENILKNVGCEFQKVFNKKN